jgi:hypothetical protein
MGHALWRCQLRTRSLGACGLSQRLCPKEKEVSPSNCNKTAGDGETVTPSLPEPGVWTGTTAVDVLGALRWKRAKTHRGSRRRKSRRIRKPDIRQQL